MKTITKTYQVPKAVYTEMQRDVLQTSDGKEFELRDKEKAEAWQAKIDKREEFKRLINYQEVDIKECWCSNTYSFNFDKAFIFDWSGIMLINEGLTDLQQIYTGYKHQLPVSERGEVYEKYYKGMRLPIGKYICIQYVDDSRDCSPSFDGFFGKIENYYTYLSSSIVELFEVRDKVAEFIIIKTQ